MGQAYQSVFDFIMDRKISTAPVGEKFPVPDNGLNMFRSYRTTADRSTPLTKAMPVEVVNDLRIEPIRVLRTGQATLDAGVPYNLVYPNPLRRRVRLRNLSPLLQYFVGASQGVSATNGFLVDVKGLPSDELVLPYTGEIWIVSTGACIINWMEEV